MQWNRRTCIHGVTEELDYHGCEECQNLALKLGWEVIPGRKTYLFRQRDLKRYGLNEETGDVERTRRA